MESTLRAAVNHWNLDRERGGGSDKGGEEHREQSYLGNFSVL